MIDSLYQTVLPVMQLLGFALVLGIFALVAWTVLTFIIDKRQKRHTIRRNYPVIGRFRYLFEHLGEFFRQYLIAMEREEQPFNRAIRSWVYRAAKDIDTTVAFGSTVNIRQPGTTLFACSPFPVQEEDALPPATITIGPYCEFPYATNAILNISAMSYGAISKPAVLALARGAKLAGCWMNTGEGGVSPYHLEGGCDLVVQIGTAKYGLRDADGNLDDNKLREIASKPQTRMFEIKLSQGAKPGKGGILPAAKVTEEVSQIRGIPAGKASISPNAHRELHNVEDLLDMIERIRSVTGKPVGFKSVIGQSEWLDDLCRAIVQRGPQAAPDFITVDSGDGGTAAAPQHHMDYVGLPIQETLPLLVDTLEQYNLRERIRVVASGKLITPSFVAWALACGADFVNSARGFMFSLGCIQAMQCNKNTCPTGITTHNEKLQYGLVVSDKTQRVCNYQRNLTHAVEQIAHSCGVSEPRQLRREHIRIVTRNGHSRSLTE